MIDAKVALRWPSEMVLVMMSCHCSRVLPLRVLTSFSTSHSGAEAKAVAPVLDQL